jgi:lipid-A-disaccharide synthase
MRIFFSAGEPSGDLHGANLIQEFRRLDPAIDCFGFGGERMAEAGCRLVYPLCELAVVGFVRVFTNFHRFLRLLGQASQALKEQRPDAVVLIDYPGFNWQIAKRAHALGIPVFYFVPPQIWAWLPGRVKKMQRWVDHVLCTLQFEEAWYHARGVPAQYIGHPYFDDLEAQQLNAAFVEDQQDRGGSIIGILPGSRNQEISLNLDTLIHAAGHIHRQRPDTRFLVACLHPAQRDRVAERLTGLDLPLEVHAGRTAEIIHLAHSCLSVSGSVSLELLYRRKPAVVVYYANRPAMWGVRLFKTCRYISLVNLLADKEVFPEYLGYCFDPAVVGGHVLRWLNNASAYKAVLADLDQLKKQVVRTGACRQAASSILEALHKRGGNTRELAA